MQPAATFESFSPVAMCLRSEDLAKVSRKPAIAMIVKTPKSHDFRKMVKVEVRGAFYWADRATGTLFHHETGHCLTTTSMQLLFDLAGQTYDAMKKRFPDLRKHHVVAKAKPGPKPGQRSGGSNQAGAL